MAQTNPTPIDALPTAPSTANPSTFASLADAFVAALTTFRTQINTLATTTYNNAVDAYNNAVSAASSASTATTQASSASSSAASAISAPGTNATATDSLLIGLGTKNLTIQTGKSLVVGMSVKVAYTSSPSNWMLGDIISYNSGTGALQVNVTLVSGSGTYAAWTVSLSAPVLTPNKSTVDMERAERMARINFTS